MVIYGHLLFKPTRVIATHFITTWRSYYLLIWVIGMGAAGLYLDSRIFVTFLPSFYREKNRNNIFTYCLLCYRNFPTHWRIFRSSPPSLLSPLPEGTHVNHADKLTESNRGSNWQTSGMIHRFERIILSRFINLTTEFQSVSSSEGFAKGWGRGLGGRMRNGFLGRFGSFEVSPGRLGFREGRGFTKCVFEASCCCLKSLWMIHVAGVLLRDVANASRMIHDASSSTDCFG